MSTTIAGNSLLYPVDFPVPSDGDAPDDASVGVAFEALADRTANSNRRLNLIEPALGAFTWYESRENFGATSITDVTGAPPGVSATAAYDVVPAMSIATDVFVEISFDLSIEYVSGYTPGVSFDIQSRPTAGGSFTSCGAPSYIQLAPGTAGGVSRQRVHLQCKQSFAAASPETNFYLFAGKPQYSIAAISNGSMIIIARRSFL